MTHFDTDVTFKETSMGNRSDKGVGKNVERKDTEEDQKEDK